MDTIENRSFNVSMTDEDVAVNVTGSLNGQVNKGAFNDIQLRVIATAEDLSDGHRQSMYLNYDQANKLIVMLQRVLNTLISERTKMMNAIQGKD